MLDEILAFALGLFIGAVISTLVIISGSQPNKSVIKHGCAQYNPITGDFEWLKAVKDE